MIRLFYDCIFSYLKYIYIFQQQVQHYGFEITNQKSSNYNISPATAYTFFISDPSNAVTDNYVIFLMISFFFFCKN